MVPVKWRLKPRRLWPRYNMTKASAQLTIPAEEPSKFALDQFLWINARGQPARDDFGSTASAFSAALLISDE
jgi:hypothetical protein